MAKFRMHLLVYGGSTCRTSESDLVAESLRIEIEEKGLQAEV